MEPFRSRAVFEEIFGASNILVYHFGTSQDSEIEIGSSKLEFENKIGLCTFDLSDKIGPSILDYLEEIGSCT